MSGPIDLKISLKNVKKSKDELYRFWRVYDQGQEVSGGKNWRENPPNLF